MGEHRKRQQKIVKTTNKERGHGQQLHPVPAHGVPARPEAGQRPGGGRTHTPSVPSGPQPRLPTGVLFSISQNLTHTPVRSPESREGAGAGLCRPYVGPSYGKATARSPAPPGGPERVNTESMCRLEEVYT